MLKVQIWIDDEDKVLNVDLAEPKINEARVVEVKDSKFKRWDNTMIQWDKMQEELYELFYQED